MGAVTSSDTDKPVDLTIRPAAEVASEIEADHKEIVEGCKIFFREKTDEALKSIRQQLHQSLLPGYKGWYKDEHGVYSVSFGLGMLPDVLSYDPSRKWFQHKSCQVAWLRHLRNELKNIYAPLGYAVKVSMDNIWIAVIFSFRG